MADVVVPRVADVVVLDFLLVMETHTAAMDGVTCTILAK